MSTTVYDKGSILDFKPEKFEVTLVREDGQTFVLEAKGWLIVCTARDGWAMSTKLDVAVECCGAVVPGWFHFNEGHGGSDSLRWRLLFDDKLSKEHLHGF
jgi:hypothetical protein